MSNQAIVPRSPELAGFDFRPLSDRIDQPLWRSIAENVRAAMFPSKDPPLHLTSRPVKVRSIWGAYDNRKKASVGSIVAHAAIIGGLVYVSLMPREVPVQKPKPNEAIIYVPTEAPVYEPIKAAELEKPGGGGGGGGDRDKLQASKGRLPKQTMDEQLAPPVAVIRNNHPALPVEPSVVMPPQVRIADNHMPNLGDPMSRIPSGPPSNGTGSGGGIGSGNGGGVGAGEGPGVGPGRGGGTGGGVFRVGGGVSAPKVIQQTEPEYSEEARKAKYQGTVVLQCVVGPDGTPRGMKVERSLGMGLDQKAIEAVKQWKYRPYGDKNDRPIDVETTVTVQFHM